MTPSELRAALASPEPELRRRAVQHIGSLDASLAPDALVRALADGDWRVRKEAARVAPSVEPRSAVVAALLVALGDREEVGLRNAAVEALTLIGPDAVPGAVAALARLDADGRKLAVEVLAGAPTLAGVHALVAALDDEDANVVAAAAEALGRAALAGDDARAHAASGLARRLEHRALVVRVAALEALAELDADVPVGALLPLLDDPHLRRSALAALAGQSSTAAVTALAAACADESLSFARDAVAALGRSLERLWSDDTSLEDAARVLVDSRGAHARLRAAVADAQPEVRAGALLALGLLRDAGDVTLLAEALEDELVSDRAEAALRRFGHDAVGPLLDRGRTAAPGGRGLALSMLPVLDPEESNALAAYREALAHPSPEVLAPALKSIAQVGRAADIEAVLRHVGSDDPKVSGAACAAFAALTARHPAAARAALGAVADDLRASVMVRGVLAEEGHGTSEDAQVLERALANEDPAVRRAAATALGGRRSSSAISAVTLALADEDDGVAHAAVRSLGRLGAGEKLASLAASTRDPARLAVVLRALGEADRERAFAAARPLVRATAALVAEAAIEVVAASTSGGALGALEDATTHADHEVVKLALSKIADRPGEQGVFALAHALSHDAADVRSCAAELLGQRAGSEARAALRARLDREENGAVRRVIMEALARDHGRDRRHGSGGPGA